MIEFFLMSQQAKDKMHHLNAVKEGGNLLNVWRSLSFGEIKSRPVSINLIVTSKCNSKCRTCDLWQTDFGEFDRMTLEHYAAIAEEFREMAIPQVAIAGGEAMLRKDLPEIIRLFDRQNIFTQLTTALPLSEKKIAVLVEAGLKRLTFSLDAHNAELYQEIRGVDWFDAVVKHLRLALTNYPQLKIDTNTVMSALNIRYVGDIVSFLHDLGVSEVSLSPINVDLDNNLIKDDKSDLFPKNEDEIREAIDTLLDLKNRLANFAPTRKFLRGMRDYLLGGGKGGFACYAGYLSADIYSDGSVRLCGSMDEIGNVIADPTQPSFLKVWQSNNAKISRENMAKGNCPGCYLSCKLEPSLIVNPVHAMVTFFEKKVISS